MSTLDSKNARPWNGELAPMNESKNLCAVCCCTNVLIYSHLCAINVSTQMNICSHDPECVSEKERERKLAKKMNTIRPPKKPYKPKSMNQLIYLRFK